MTSDQLKLREGQWGTQEVDYKSLYKRKNSSGRRDAGNIIMKQKGLDFIPEGLAKIPVTEGICCVSYRDAPETCPTAKVAQVHVSHISLAQD